MAVGLKIISGDFVIDNTGFLTSVSGRDKCARDFEKMLRTQAVNTITEEANTTSRRYNPLYGTKLNDKDSFKGLSVDATIDLINTSLRESIAYYLSIQEQRKNLSVDEIINDIEFNTYLDPEDSRYILIDIKVTTAGGNELKIPTFEQRIV